MHGCNIISKYVSESLLPDTQQDEGCVKKLLITAYEHDEAVMMNHAQA